MFYPIVSAAAGSITVAGDVTGTLPDVTENDVYYFLIPPAGVDRTDGSLSLAPTEPVSRYLAFQYFYLPPVLGVYVDDERVTEAGIYGRQAGDNLAGRIEGRYLQLDVMTARAITGSANVDAATDSPSFQVVLLSAGPKCGPDVTEWFRRELQLWLDFARALNNLAKKWGPEDASWYEPDAAYIKGYQYALLAIVAKQMKYHPNTTFSSPNCPRGEKCKETVTLCEKCIHRSELGNFLYGAVARVFQMTWLQTWAGSIAGNRGKRTDADAAAVELGYDFVDGGGGDLCGMLGKKENKENWEDMQSDAPKECTACFESVNPAANHTEFPDTSKLKKNDAIEIKLPKNVS